MTEQQYLETMIQKNGLLLVSIAIAVCVLQIAGEWRIYKKAGKHGWEALVPFYSSYIQYEIFWGNGWLFLIATAFSIIGNYGDSVSVINAVCLVGLLIIEVMHCSRMAKAFGKSAWYAVGLLLLHPVFVCMLGFGNAEYEGVPEE